MLVFQAGILSSSAMFAGQSMTAKLAEWVVDEARKGPQGPVQLDAWPSGCHHQMWPLSFPWWMLCMDLCRNPSGSSLTGPETCRASLTHTHTLEALFPLLWLCAIERSDVIGRVKAQHSDSDSLRRTPLVSFPVVVETCWDFFSNKTRTHQSLLDEFQSLWRPPTWSTVHMGSHCCPENLIQSAAFVTWTLTVSHFLYKTIPLSILNIQASRSIPGSLINQLNVCFDQLTWMIYWHHHYILLFIQGSSFLFKLFSPGLWSFTLSSVSCTPPSIVIWVEMTGYYRRCRRIS